MVVVLLLLVVTVTIVVAGVIVKRKQSCSTCRGEIINKNCHVTSSMQLRFQSQMEEWIGHQHLQELSSPTKLTLRYSRRTLPMSKQRNHGDRGSMTHKTGQQQRETMKALSQFMSTRKCCLRGKRVVQTTWTSTDKMYGTSTIFTCVT